MARRFYAPVLVSWSRRYLEQGTVEIHVTSDLRASCAGVVSYRLTDVAGKTLNVDSTPFRISPRRTKRIRTLSLSRYLEVQGRRDLMLWLELEVRGEIVSSNLVCLAKPKQLELRDPQISLQVKKEQGAFQLRLRARKPALWAWLEVDGCDAALSDNYFHLPPGQTKVITFVPSEELALKALRAQVVVRSLVDTY